MSNEPAAPSEVRPRRVVTDRRGGRSRPPYDSFNLGSHVGDDPGDVAANRARVARELGVGEDRLVWMDQVHGTGVAVVDGPQDGPVAGTDGLVTATRGLVLAVLAADCVPVLLADHRAGVVAAVHAGREGVRKGVLPAALSAMASLGARARDVTALLGPAVCGACYEVPAEMQHEVARIAPAAAVPTRAGTTGLDLRAGVEQILRRAGIPEVVQDPRCTAEDPALFSHRRDGVTGRQAGLVWLA
ncbi:peptidoglycan editing factor PgeF [Blastococcus sp. MG754426]|uniref:peptidoglycan editing factor PgeF n=1 Tax=unclassified Blastococcus TaxID=2619396 RepID=UPI001EF0E7AF|nr:MULTISPECIES: peptidoglycan editing factor PgeF [unclassified Blastococcus]MCF6509504.1 peptidoglycan editing factor PgeF [Blastococcus sp. MG754426]MCF6514465.1 peptidoglycan editing factor PgeF [Blastococcus sp. MG754427]MCF6737679.1 peptidoglycan editing factor PgeF [Blastococcus sp. KM273129]